MKIKVLIVGAGPSGSACANKLQQAGVDCLLVDKRKFPRVKLCAGLMTHKSQDCLRKLLGKEAYDACLNATLASKEEKFSLYKGKEMLVECKPQEPITLINRPKFDAWLIEHYKSQGGKFMDGEELIGLDANKNIATFQDMEVEYDYLVAADGANSSVERLLDKLPVKPFKHKAKSSMCIEINVDREDLDMDGVNVYFDYVPNSYAWAFSKGEKVCLGLVKLAGLSMDANEAMRKFIRDLSVKNPEKYPLKGAMIPLGNYMKYPICGNILFAGDAAGLVEPLTGEGIYYALQSGVYAAETVITGSTDMAPIYEKKISYLKKLIDKGAFYQSLLEKPWCVNLLYDHAHKHPNFINHFYYTQIEHGCLDGFIKIVLKYFRNR